VLLCCCAAVLLQLGKKAARRATRKTDLDKEFEEAEAGPDLAQLALLQSQMLEVRWGWLGAACWGLLAELGIWVVGCVLLVGWFVLGLLGVAC
jgi:hypothetical protein